MIVISGLAWFFGISAVLSSIVLLVGRHHFSDVTFGKVFQLTLRLWLLAFVWLFMFLLASRT